MDKFTVRPLPKKMLCDDLANKVFPDPVQPLKESAKALFGDLLFRCPTIALSTVLAPHEPKIQTQQSRRNFR